MTQSLILAVKRLKHTVSFNHALCVGHINTATLVRWSCTCRWRPRTFGHEVDMNFEVHNNAEVVLVDTSNDETVSIFVGFRNVRKGWLVSNDDSGTLSFVSLIAGS